jgi:hypothetical protein
VIRIPSAISENKPMIKASPAHFYCTQINEVFELEIVAENMGNLHSWRVELTYDSKVLVYIFNEEGPFLQQAGPTVYLSSINDEGNGVVISGVQLTREGASGSGTLSKIRFKITEETVETHVNITDYMALEKPNDKGIKPLIDVNVAGAMVSLTSPGTLIAHAGSDLVVDEGVSVSFDGSLSRGTGLTYEWTFRDGGEKILTGLRPEYTFTLPGEYMVTLEVSDGSRTSTDIVQITVRDVTPPVPAVKITGLSEDDRAEVGDHVILDASGSQDPENGTIWKYEWEMEDGSKSTEKKLVYTPTEEGETKIILRLTDARQNTAVEIITIKTGKGFPTLTALILLILTIVGVFFIYHKQRR